MKKLILLSLFLTILGTVTAQRKYVTDNMPFAKPRLYEPAVSPGGMASPLENATVFLKGSSVVSIGNTYGIDYQTYNSGNLMNRIFEFPDGTIGATWMNKGQTGVPDRGTAYNYFNGTTWDVMAPHLGGDPNNAFPSYSPWGTNGEIVVHYRYIANEGPLKILRRENKGEGEWQESVLNPPEGNYSLVWHSMITSGENHEYLHILAFVYDDPYQGQDDALLYYRSPDGGVTWDINGVVIEGLGPDFYTAISSLKYSWAQPVGSTIAFTYGFDEFDGLLFKSTDNGTTWQKTVVYQSPFSPLNVPAETPEYGCGDGTSSIVLDSQGNAHIVFGRMRRLHNTITGQGWYYIPLGSEGLIYWNESMPALDSNIVSSYTLDYLAAGGNLVAWIIPTSVPLILDPDQPTYGVGLTSQPHLGIDNEDNLFLVYAALAPEYLDFEGKFYYRHIYSNASFNGGITWSGPQDLTNDDYFMFSECVFPAIAPKINQKVHIVFQEDYIPGNGEGFGLGEENFIDYINFDTEFFVSVPEKETVRDVEVSQNYPNPASGITRFGLKLQRDADVTVSMTDLLGKEINRNKIGKLAAGNHLLSLDVTGLASGVYYYSVQSGKQRIIHKMMVR